MKFVYKRESCPIILVTGEDRIDFLHRISSQDFKTAKQGDALSGAFLNANGCVVSLFHAQVLNESVRLFVEPQSKEVTLSFLEKYHFREKLRFVDESKQKIWWEVRDDNFDRSGFNTFEIFTAEKWGETGYLIGMSPSLESDFLSKLGNAKIISEKEYYAEKARELFPKDRIDINEGVILLEAGLYNYFHRQKGCYPGQEVIERILTYGNVPKKLVLLEGTEVSTDFPADLFRDGKKVGTVTSKHQNNGQCHLYLATCSRNTAIIGTELMLGDAPLKIIKSISELPR